MRSFFRSFLASLVAIIVLWGCESDVTGLPPLGNAVLNDASYRLGPGDKLSLTVFAAKDLSSDTLQVSAEGTIALPLVGNVQAAGLTMAQLGQAIRDKLRGGYLRD